MYITEKTITYFIFVIRMIPVAVLHCPLHFQLIVCLSLYLHMCYFQVFLLYRHSRELNSREAKAFNIIIQKVTVPCADPYETSNLYFKGPLTSRIN